MKWRYQIQPWLERCPALYLNALSVKRLFHEERSRIITRRHDCVIEGFPRSANSFAYRAFDQANKLSLKIATHTHSPAQVLQAAKWGIPCMVLIRNPLDAIIGDLAFSRHKGLHGRGEPALLPTRRELLFTLQRWCFFHERILPVRHHLFIAEFDEVVRDFAQVSQRFICYAKRDWEPYDPEIIPAETILNTHVYMGPNEEREKIKALVREPMLLLERQGALKRAKALYAEIGKN